MNIQPPNIPLSFAAYCWEIGNLPLTPANTTMVNVLNTMLERKRHSKRIAFVLDGRVDSSKVESLFLSYLMMNSENKDYVWATNSSNKYLRYNKQCFCNNWNDGLEHTPKTPVLNGDTTSLSSKVSIDALGKGDTFFGNNRLFFKSLPEGKVTGLAFDGVVLNVHHATLGSAISGIAEYNKMQFNNVSDRLHRDHFKVLFCSSVAATELMWHVVRQDQQRQQAEGKVRKWHMITPTNER
jgi:hypothetical protein